MVMFAGKCSGQIMMGVNLVLTGSRARAREPLIRPKQHVGRNASAMPLCMDAEAHRFYSHTSLHPDTL